MVWVFTRSSRATAVFVWPAHSRMTHAQQPSLERRARLSSRQFRVLGWENAFCRYPVLRAWDSGHSSERSGIGWRSSATGTKAADQRHTLHLLPEPREVGVFLLDGGVDYQVVDPQLQMAGMYRLGHLVPVPRPGDDLDRGRIAALPLTVVPEPRDPVGQLVQGDLRRVPAVADPRHPPEGCVAVTAPHHRNGRLRRPGMHAAPGDPVELAPEIDHLARP